MLGKSLVIHCHRIAIAATALLAATNLIGCKADSNYFSSANASSSSDGGTVDATAGFRVSIKPKTGVDSFIHKFGERYSPTTHCEVPLSELSTRTSIQCMLNMMEYDLWFYGYETELSVPKGACEFVRDIPYRSYTSRPGTGMRNAAISTTNGLITACNIDGAAGTIAGGGSSCLGAEGTISAGGGVTCAYDYSDDTGGTNCCEGVANVSVTASVTTTAPPTSTVVNVETDFGGRYSACLYSAHDYIENWPLDLEQKAANALYDVSGGASLVRATKIPGAFTLFAKDKRYYSAANVLNAGFHSWAAYAANPATWSSTHVTPVAISPVADASGNAITSTGDGAHVYQCVGSAGEIKHEIRVYVNEWNTIEDYTAFKTDGNPAAVTPTRTGTAGVDCSAVNSGRTCNSIWGLDDIVNIYGATAYPNDYLRGPPN